MLKHFWHRVFLYIKHHFIPGAHNAYRPHILNRNWLVFFLAVMLATEGFLVASMMSGQSVHNFLAAVVPGEIVALTNTERESYKLGTLTENKTLAKAAQAKAEDMAAKGYFSHNGPDGKEPWQWITEARYEYQYAGENLAVRFIDSKDVVTAWMASPSHKANIVKSAYTDIGVGVAPGMYKGEPATYVVQYFGKPTVAQAALDKKKSSPATPTAQGGVNGNVLGAETVVFSPTTVGGYLKAAMQEFIKQVAGAIAEPRSTSNIILGSIATLLLIALALAFFIHIHIQRAQMLAAGTAVFSFALFLILLNSSALSSTISSADQSASVVQANTMRVVVDEEAASIVITKPIFTQ